ncbi:MAG: peptigoglycan-binding protein LysM, partial [Xanthobacteraceae bacterium]
MPVPAATTADTGAAAPATAQASATAEPPKVVEATPADTPDGTTIMAPEQTVPPKKAKRHATS